MSKHDREANKKLTHGEMRKILEEKAPSEEVRRKTKEVIKKRVNAIKNLSGK